MTESTGTRGVCDRTPACLASRPRRQRLPIRGLVQDICSFGAMKVLEGLKAIEPGSAVPVAELGLPVSGENGLLLVFWKST